MIAGKRVVVVMPAYNAEATLARTVAEVPRDVVDDILVVDDASRDGTVAEAARLGLEARQHPKNQGYGANQRTCYRWALERGADVVVMLHPDYQYRPALVPAMAELVARGGYDLALGSRVLGAGALKGGMPLYKYVSNRLLTAAENALLDRKLSEYHTGFRAFSADVLRGLPLDRLSDDWAFDAEVLAYSVWRGWSIGEVSCPAYYAGDSSSISAVESVGYGLDVLGVSLRCRLALLGWPTGLFRSL